MEPTFATAIQIHHVRHLQDIEIPLSQETRKHLISKHSCRGSD